MTAPTVDLTLDPRLAVAGRDAGVDHPRRSLRGTAYRAVVRHGNPASRDRHESFGFADGWGSVIAALARLVA